MTESAEVGEFRLKDAQSRIGDKLGVSSWVFIDQVQVNVFGEVTRWRTPGHCDPEYAKTTPYGGTLMHGFHMLGLLSHFYQDAQLWPVEGHTPLNYGLDKVRVLQPVVVGEGVKLRSHISLLEVNEKSNDEYLVKTCHEVEVAGLDKYALYAEYLTYWLPKP